MTATATTPTQAQPGVWSRLRPFEWACVAVIAFAFLLRIDFVLNPTIIWDSAWYTMLARSFSEDGTFWLRWSHEPRTYTGYWPPLFPIFASPFVKLFGPSYSSVAMASVTAAALLTAAVFLTTRGMFGRTRAFAAAALIAASPAFTASDYRAMSESLLALTVVLTMWALLKGVEKPKWLPLAFAFGLLAYLAKANLGIPLVAAGGVAFGLWLGWARGWKRTFGHPAFIATGVAGVIALAIFGLTRTGKLGGIGVGVIDPVKIAIAHPLWPFLVLFKFAFAASFLIVVTLPFSLHVRKAIPFLLNPRRDARMGTLWLAVLLPLVATAIFTASFLITEQRGPTQFHNVADAFGRDFGDGFIELTATIALLVDFDNVRYLTPSIVPFVWLLLPHFPFESDVTPPTRAESAHVRRGREQAFAIAAAAYVVLLLLNPVAGMRNFPAAMQLSRLALFLQLALIPLALAYLAHRKGWSLITRTTAKGDVVYRYVEAPGRRVRWGVVAGIAFGGVALAYVASAWYGFIALGLIVALAAHTSRGAVITMALVLLSATAAGLSTNIPTETASDWIEENVPPGTVAGMPEPIVYFAAVAPSSLKLTHFELRDGVPDEVDLVLLEGLTGVEPPDANFTHVITWDYEFEFSPALEARLALEAGLLGNRFLTQSSAGLSLHVRNGTEAAEALLSDRALQP